MILGKHAGTIALVILPSITWTLIFRQPILVSDPLLFVPLELIMAWRFRVIFRCFWIFLITYGLLIRWGIYPEAYAFYLNVLFQSLGSPQSVAVLAALSLFCLTLFFPTKFCFSWKTPVLLFAVALFCSLNIIKITKTGREWLAFVKTPTLRAISYIVSSPSLAFISSEGIGTVMYDPLLRELSQHGAPPKVFIIVLEAWGENQQSLAAVKNHALSMGFDRVVSGFVPYRGATLAGEVRVLCGQSLNYTEPRQSLLDCLPRRLSTQGYDTVSIHGNSGLFYYRDLLYPQIGFTRQRFLDELPHRPLCGGPFVGACDDDVIYDALEELRAAGPRLVYVMSLSAHIPVSGEILSRNYIQSVPRQLIGNDSQTVNRAAIIQTLSGVIKVKGRSVIYFVGDHNPAGYEESKQVMDGLVPFIIVHNLNAD